MKFDQQVLGGKEVFDIYKIPLMKDSVGKWAELSELSETKSHKTLDYFQISLF